MYCSRITYQCYWCSYTCINFVVFDNSPCLPLFTYHFFYQQAKFDTQSKLKSLQSEHEQLQETHDEEMDNKSSLQTQLASAKSEAATWKNKFETEATPRIEELEEGK